VVCMKQVSWFWSRCALHYQKNVWSQLYDEQTGKTHYVNVGVMCMDDFGDLFLISKVD